MVALSASRRVRVVWKFEYRRVFPVPVQHANLGPRTLDGRLVDAVSRRRPDASNSLPSERDPEVGLDESRHQHRPYPRTVAPEADDLVLHDVERPFRAAVPAGAEPQRVMPRL